MCAEQVGDDVADELERENYSEWDYDDDESTLHPGAKSKSYMVLDHYQAGSDSS